MFGATNVFRLRVVSGGQISWYNGTAYTNIGGANVIPLDTWKLVKVVANASTNQASLYVDGVLIGAANAIGEQGTGAATMNGLLFSSGGAAARAPRRCSTTFLSTEIFLRCRRASERTLQRAVPRGAGRFFVPAG